MQHRPSPNTVAFNSTDDAIITTYVEFSSALFLLRPKVVAYSGDVHSCGPSKKSPLGASSPPVLVVGSKLDQVVVARDRSVNSHHNHLPLHVPRNGSVFACTYNLPELRLVRRSFATFLLPLSVSGFFDKNLHTAAVAFVEFIG